MAKRPRSFDFLTGLLLSGGLMAQHSVCALEPGGMRTNWGTRANEGTPDLLPDYEPSVGAVAKQLAPLCGHENSDPAKVAQVILRLAASDRLPAHLLTVSDAIQAEAARAAETSADERGEAAGGR